MQAYLKKACIKPFVKHSAFFIISLQNECFPGCTRTILYVRPCVCVFVCVQNTRNVVSQTPPHGFAAILLKKLYKQWSHNEVLQDIILKSQLHLVSELSPLELSRFSKRVSNSSNFVSGTRPTVLLYE